MAQTCIYKGLKIGCYLPAVTLVITAGIWYNKDVVESRYFRRLECDEKMFSIRVPFRKISFVDKERNFTEVLDFATYTKKEAMEMYKDKGLIVSFERGFRVFDIAKEDIPNHVFERIYNEMKEGK